MIVYFLSIVIVNGGDGRSVAIQRNGKKNATNFLN